MMSRAFLFAMVLSFAPLAGFAAPDVSSSAALSSTSALSLTGSPAIWNPSIQGNRITALCEDGRGRVFAASEENGVWMRGRQGSWTAFTPKNSSIASDMIYALAVDRQGRVWAGTARNGISVFNGRAWKNYDVLQAPIGERIFDIAVSPLDGDVWIASNVGLTRYDVETDTWTTQYPTFKLPFSHLQSLAFTRSGVLFAGTQTQGLLISQPQKDKNANIEYSIWRNVKAPAVLPDVPSGAGLPTDMINDILVARDKTVYVATTTGLAWSKNSGATWSYKRGRDWVEKARQRWFPAAMKERPSEQDKAGALNEDYVTSLAQDAAGNLWIGYWRQGYEVWDARLERRVLSGHPPNGWLKDLVSDDALSDGDGDYVKCLLIMQNGTPLIGRYGAGLTVAPKMFVSTAATTTATTTAATSKTATSSTRSAGVPVAATPIDASVASVYPAFPSPQSAPTLAEINALLKQLASVPVAPNKSASPVIALDDDWNTRGDWIGRYGKYWANLCAMISPEDYIWGAGQKRIRYFSQIGANAPNDAVRYWVHWLQVDNPNSLEIPLPYMHSRVLKGYATWKDNRRQAEQDDHGENYPYEKDGPHVYMTMDVPPGDWQLSLYNTNKDGDGGDNRKRDFRVSIRNHTLLTQLSDISDFHSQPELATARFRDFRGGVWKRFLVRGPRELTIEVNKNSSFNTLLAGVMLDELKEKPAPYFRGVGEDRALDVKLAKVAKARVKETSSTRSRRFAPVTGEADAANRLFTELDWLRVANPQWWAQSSRKFYLPLTLWMEAQQKLKTPNAIKDKAKTDELRKRQTRLATCWWALRLFERSEEAQRKSGATPARDIEKALRFNNEPRDSGEGYKFVTEYLAKRKTANQISLDANAKGK